MLAWKLILKKESYFLSEKTPKKQNNGHLPQTKTFVNKKTTNSLN